MHCFSDSLIVKYLFIILAAKEHHQCNHYFSIVFQEIKNVFCNLSVCSNSTKQYAQTLSVCFQHFEGVFLNAAQF